MCEVKRSPLLGEHNDEVLGKVLGYTAKQIAEIKASGAMSMGGAGLDRMWCAITTTASSSVNGGLPVSI